MILNKRSLILVLVSLSLVSNGSETNKNMSEVLKDIFLTTQFNYLDLEWGLRTARDSFLVLKKSELQTDSKKKINFSQMHANFIMKLYNDLQSKDYDIYKLFTIENSFLNGHFDRNEIIVRNVSSSALRKAVENIQSAAEQNLVPFYNFSNSDYNIPEILSLNDTNFESFLKHKIENNLSDLGYFFLEIFATLIGLSWGVISTALYGLEPNNGE